ncbi:carboxypeptidase A1-like isoform X2 [Heptranchias perlo]|uniref:carboxypeptidase A1-like isoform X2 n=1 Tax=Heptranchias perlo TaxID=212740 RepID=UPI0035598D57
MRELWFFLSIVLVAAYRRQTFVGDQVLRIRASSQEQLALIRSLEELEHLKLDFWKEPTTPALPIDLRVPGRHVRAVKAFLESNGIAYSIMIKNLQTLVDEENVSQLVSELRQNGTYSFNYKSYHTLKEFSTGHKRPAVWIDSGIHGREWISPAIAIWLAKKIATDYGNDPSVTSLLNKMDIFMAIMVNPDGYVYTRTKNRMWRKTMSKRPGSHCFGVDANRNFDANFGGRGSSRVACSERYCGPHVNSEPEVKAIVDFIGRHGNFTAFITLHNYLQLLLYPYGYTEEPPENIEELDTLASEATEALASLYGTRYSHGSIIQTINESSGNSIDWSYNQGIKYSYAFELRDEGQYGFMLPWNQIVPTAEETWLAIKKIMEHACNHLP